MTASEIRQDARNIMMGLWTTCVPIWFIYIAVLGAASGIIGLAASYLGTIASLIIGGPMLMGITKIFLRIYKGEYISLEQLFEGFSDFSRTLTAYLLMCIYIFLWMLLLIVPGIIAALGYSMTFFILAENPQMSGQEALQKSKEMMMGHKWELFCLQLSFIGWLIVACLTFGIGLLWLQSYMMSAYVIFYQNLKGTHGVKTEPEAEPEFTIVDNGY